MRFLAILFCYYDFPYANFGLFYFISAIFWAKIAQNWHKTNRNNKLKWPKMARGNANFFPESKVTLGQDPPHDWKN